MSDVKLGTAPELGAGRDAIHVAIAPCVAAEKLYPGQHVGKVGDKYGPSQSPIGIVDPFLTHPVFPGELFWICLYPQTVTGMRHHWSHPIFDEVPPAITEKQDAMATIESGAAMCGYSVERFLEICSDFAAQINDDQYPEFYLDNSQRYDNVDFDEEFWDAFEKVTGNRKPKKDYGAPFTCAC